METKFTRRLTFALSIMAMSSCGSCAELTQINRNAQTTAENFFKITDSVETICRSLQTDQQATLGNYTGKFYTVVGEIDSAGYLNSTLGRYGVKITSGPAEITAYTNDANAISGLKRGEFIQTTGLMTAPMYYGRGATCLFTLKNAKFQPAEAQ
jgi:hypothetical protein